MVYYIGIPATDLSMMVSSVTRTGNITLLSADALINLRTFHHGTLLSNIMVRKRPNDIRKQGAHSRAILLHT